MVFRVKVLKEFEQRNGTEEIKRFDGKTGEEKIIEKPIIYSFTVGQEIVGKQAEFMKNKHPDKLEVIGGDWEKAKFDEEEYFKKQVAREEKYKEEAEKEREDQEKKKRDAHKKEMGKSGKKSKKSGKRSK